LYPAREAFSEERVAGFPIAPSLIAFPGTRKQKTEAAPHDAAAGSLALSPYGKRRKFNSEASLGKTGALAW
jgi:hypothetical protein